jgi:hypothetical protein
MEKTDIRKIVIEGESGDWGQSYGDSCKIIRIYIYINIYILDSPGLG